MGSKTEMSERARGGLLPKVEEPCSCAKMVYLWLSGPFVVRSNKPTPKIPAGNQHALLLLIPRQAQLPAPHNAKRKKT